MATWIGGPLLDPLGAALGAGFGQGIGKYFEGKAMKSDTQALIEYLRNMQGAQQFGGAMAGSAVGGPLGGFMGAAAAPDLSGMVTPPKLKTPEMNKMLLQLELGKVLDPMQQAQKALYEAETEESRARAANYLAQANEPPEMPSVEQQRHYAALDAGHEMGSPGYWDFVSRPSEATPSKQIGQQMEILQNRMDTMRQQGVADDSQAMVATQTRWDELAKLQSATTNIDIGPDIGQATKNKIEGELIDLDKNLAQLEQADKLSKPEYFESPSKVAGWLTTQQEKAGGFLGSPSEARRQWVQDRQNFLAAAQRNFLVFRKFITGVAGGEKEFREIAFAQPDPRNDSYSQYMGKYQSAKDAALMLRGLLADMRNNGIPLTSENVSDEIRSRGLTPPRAVLDTSPLTATNPNTGSQIISYDGGKTWQPKTR